MTDMQRWTPAWDGKEVGTYADSAGEYVLYADHVEALRQARADERLEQIAGGEAWQIGYEDGRQSALLSAVQRVEALPVYLVDVRRDAFDQPQYQQTVGLAEVIAAIKGQQ